jgi:hypothetical protein
MRAARLIHLIEIHSAGLTSDVLQDLATNPRTPSFRAVPRTELESRTASLYRNLGEWIGEARDDSVRAEYEEWGRRAFVRASS